MKKLIPNEQLLNRKYSEYFHNIANLFKKGLLKENSDTIKNEYRNNFSYLFDSIDSSKKNKNRTAYIFTSQIVSFNHSPTYLCLYYASILEEIFNRVVIVSTPPIHFDDLFSFNSTIQNGWSKPSNKQTMGLINLEKTELYNCETDFSSIKETIIETLECTKDDLYILIGHSNIFFDSIRSRHKVVRPQIDFSLPTTAKFLTGSFKLENHYNLYHEKMSSLEIPTCEGIGIYKITPHSKLDLIRYKNIKRLKKKFRIIIPGNRVLDEIDTEANRSLLQRINSLENVEIHTIGQFQGKSKRIQFSGFEIYAHPSSPVIDQALIEYDLVLNIYREGNGIYGALAFNGGIPAISPPNCGFSNATPIPICYNNDDQALRIIERIKNSKSFRERLVRKQDRIFLKMLSHGSVAKKRLQQFIL